MAIDLSPVTGPLGGLGTMANTTISTFAMFIKLLIQYAWVLVILAALFLFQRFRKTYSIMGILINKRGASDSVRIDFGKLVRIQDAETGISVNGIAWRAKKKITEMLPASCYYMSNWGFAVAIIREGVNGELVPVILKESGNESYLKPLDADVEAIRQDRYMALAKFHNPKKQKWFENPTILQIGFGVLIVVCMYFVKQGMVDVASSMGAIATALEHLVKGGTV